MAQGNIDEFLTPEAMLTPGAAGALTMMITNAITANFDAHRAFTGLLISFLFGALVFAAVRSVWQKAIYYVINSLIIFCVALGANTVGGVTKVATFDPISAAFAQNARPNEDAARLEALKEALAQEQKLIELKQSGADEARIRKLEIDQNNTLRGISERSAGSTIQDAKGFFRPWIK
jgi:hypothetical protein